MATIKSYSDLQQSKKLAEILPLESADMYIYKNIFFGALSCFNSTTQVGEYIKLIDKESKAYPCWSLAALISVLPYKLQNILDINGFQEDRKEKYVIGSVENNRYDCYADNPVDACYEMIIHLHELNLL